MLRCICCGKIIKYGEGLCLSSMRGISELCYKLKCPVICDDCLKQICEICRERGENGKD